MIFDLGDYRNIETIDYLIEKYQDEIWKLKNEKSLTTQKEKIISANETIIYWNGECVANPTNLLGHNEVVFTLNMKVFPQIFYWLTDNYKNKPQYFQIEIVEGDKLNLKPVDIQVDFEAVQ